MARRSQDQLLKGFADAAQSLKLYRRAELLDQKDRPLIEQLYVDPLPNNAVLSAMLRPNTTLWLAARARANRLSSSAHSTKFGSRNELYQHISI
jgi:hypothetical protein